MTENTTGKKSLFTVKKVLRILALLCLVFVFCPAFLVSCSGQEVNVSVMTAVGGLSAYGEKIVDPHPIMLLCLVIPIAMLVLLFVKKFADKKVATMILACAVVDIIMWFVFRSGAKKIAEDNYCTFKTTVWFVFNIIALILMIVLTAMVLINKLQMESQLVGASSYVGIEKKPQEPKEAPIGYCSNCGTPLVYESKFCTTCGTPVPEEMIAAAEAARKAQEEAVETEENSEKPLFCHQCGAKLDPDAKFCESCGKKVE